VPQIEKIMEETKINKKRKSQKYQKQSENHVISPEEREIFYGGNDLWKR